jgi:ubiquinone/menaquinone biosynthesis C-methylase UbiE
VAEGASTWADLGAGAGTFTRALASLLGRSGTVYAVDRDPRALLEITRGFGGERSAQIHAVVGDFTDRLELPPLDGIVIANALHYVPYGDQTRVLRQLASLAKRKAPLVIVEYERTNANPWVPYPITISRLTTVAREAGLAAPTPLASRPSRFSGSIYSAVVRHD